LSVSTTLRIWSAEIARWRALVDAAKIPPLD
jgi:hypothetical protein